MNGSISRVLRWVPAAGWMGMIFYMSSQPGGESGAFSKMVLEFLASWGLDLRAFFGDHAFWVIRKMAHFTEYFILYFLMWLALGSLTQWPRKALVAFFVTVLYACADEFHQLFVPNRVGDVLDVAIDSLGAAFGMGLTFVWVWFKRKRAHAPVSSAIQSK